MHEVREVIKEVLRNSILGGVSYLLVDGVLNSLIFAIFGDRLDLQYIAVIVVAVGYVLRGIEKQLHKAGKLSLPF